MDLAENLVWSKETITQKTTRELKDKNSKSLLTQAKEGEEILARLPAILKKANIYWYETLKWDTEKLFPKKLIVEFDQWWLIECRKKQIEKKE